MPQPDVSATSEPPPAGTPSFFRRLFGRHNESGHSSPVTIPTELPQEPEHELDLNDPAKPDLIRRISRRVVPGLPRAQTFKRQQSEKRTNLAPVEPTADERRAVSVDRRSREPRASSISRSYVNPRTSAPGFLGSHQDEAPRFFPLPPSLADEDEEEEEEQEEEEPIEAKLDRMMRKDDDVTAADDCPPHDALSMTDTHSMTTSQYDALIHEELEKTWILNLSMHFRDRSKREKFFVTYREQEHLWRRVTISVDYRNAPMNSLEMDLIHTHYQRDKSAKIYEAIRESLRDIQFYDTVTNLKLQTTDGRLHVHVVEDGNEIINYPPVAQIKHLGCRRIRERDITFDSHMSGFVYKVSVNKRPLIKKEIPSPDTIDEFLYEINALSRLRYSRNVIHFYGVVVDDHDETVKGLLISYAEQGALIDIIYETCKDGKYDLPWSTRQKWAHQIVQGLSDIHETGFVQGDFTLSNIVIDEHGDAKIIDINRRGCPVGWEPPEATPLIECGQRISMYIGVKSDLYQLGMVLWALAMQEDEPEAQGRPLVLGLEVTVPDWYRQMTEICLSNDPRMRLPASSLLRMFPAAADGEESGDSNRQPPISVDDGYSLQQYLVEGYHEDGHPRIKTVEPSSDWSYVSRPRAEATPPGYEPYYYTRGRSPPSPLPSNFDGCESTRGGYNIPAWAANKNIPSSYSDVDVDETPMAELPQLIVEDTTKYSAAARQDQLEFAAEDGDKSRPTGEPLESSNIADEPLTSATTAAAQSEASPAELARKALTVGETGKVLKGSNSPVTYSSKLGASGLALTTHSSEDNAIQIRPTIFSQDSAENIDVSPHHASTEADDTKGILKPALKDKQEQQRPIHGVGEGRRKFLDELERFDLPSASQPLLNGLEAAPSIQPDNSSATGRREPGSLAEERERYPLQMSGKTVPDARCNYTLTASSHSSGHSFPGACIDEKSSDQARPRRSNEEGVNVGAGQTATHNEPQSVDPRPTELLVSQERESPVYLTNYDEQMQEKGMIDDDFNVVVLPRAVSPDYDNDRHQ